MLEVIVIVAFPFPPVAVVGVVRGNHHETAFVVENGAVMDSSNVAVVVGFPSHASGLARGADFNVGYLVLGFDVENATVERMIEGQFHEVAVGEDLFQLAGHARPLAITPEVVQHEKTAVEQVVAQRDHLFLGQIQTARFDHVNERVIGQFLVGES